jgi:hypothetical protein
MFRRMKKLLAGLAFLALCASDAVAQTPPFPATLPANTVVGRLGTGPGPAQAIPFSRFIAELPQGTVTINPPILGSASDRTGVLWTITTDIANVATGFTSDTGQIFNWIATYGDHSSGFSAPNGKTTFAPVRYNISGPAAGQKLGLWVNQLCAGGGDCISNGVNQYYYGGTNAAGDEGSQIFGGFVQQPTTFFHLAPTVVTTGGGSTTSTQAITGNYIAQTVTVASSTGFTVGEWVNVNQASNPTTVGGGLSEAVQLTAVASGTLTGAFRLSQPNGVTIAPATVLTVPNSSAVGQHRYAVNLSTTSYSTGTAVFDFTVTNNYIGTGTNWTNTMVGGNAGRPGCISMNGDVISGVNRQTWRTIQTVNSTTSISPQQPGHDPWDVANTGYIIRPCAFILRVNPGAPSAGLMQVILENNSFTWTAGDDIEFPVGPGFATVGGKIDLYSYFPATNNTGLLITEYGPVAPLKWINLVNIGGGSSPTVNATNQSTFINADNGVTPGSINYFARASGVNNFASVSIANGGSYNLTTYGLLQSGLTENVNMAKGVGGQGAGIEHDPVWNHNSVHEGVTVDATDTLSSAASLLFAGKIASVEKFSVRKDGEVTAAGNFKTSAAAKTLTLKQGANGSVGTFVCTSGGSITVTNSNVAITDTIIISLNTAGGTISTAPALNAITAATSFVAKCATNDTATYNYALIKNAS